MKISIGCSSCQSRTTQEYKSNYLTFLGLRKKCGVKRISAAKNHPSSHKEDLGLSSEKNLHGWLQKCFDWDALILHNLFFIFQNLEKPGIMNGIDKWKINILKKRQIGNWVEIQQRLYHSLHMLVLLPLGLLVFSVEHFGGFLLHR